MDVKRVGITLVVLMALVVPAFAQGAILSWDDAPITPQNRHNGDWMVNAGWYSPEEVYGPFAEETFEVGDETEFSSLFYDFDDTKETFVLRYKSDAAYFWFPRQVDVDQDDLAAAADYVDNIMIPFIRSVFGVESLPGIDGDPRLHIVHEEALGYGAVGVFRPDDQCAQFLCHSGNQRDAIYYSLDWGEVNSEAYRTTITHEFQHVIRYSVDGNEHRWMNEGLSQLAEHLSGFAPQYSVGENLNIFLENTDNRLDGWADFQTDPAIYYGSSYLMMVYLYERFGLDFIRALATSPYDGLAAVHRTLQDTDAGTDLDSVFADWLVANYLDDPYVGDGRYYYSTLTLPIAIGTTPLHFATGSPSHFERDINQYGSVYFDLPAGEYSIAFNGVEATPISDAVPYSGEWIWWSYNGEASATRLTRRVDLSNLEHATLQYAVWYNTELDFDWGDVMVSVDDGQHWKALSSHTMYPATDNIPVPHYSGDSSGWINEEIDLTPLVGGEILLRFEYVTDGSLSQQGMMLDDIAIPEIGFFDDAEILDTTWQTEGFLRIPEAVPQNWFVAVASRGKTSMLDMMALSADHVGQLDVAVPEGGVLIIGAMAPMTGEKASYDLVIEALR